ncbi:MAG: flagellar hook-associated protein FlgK [Acidobacteria bacterium]|nr:flagellar hook-associated protein FlgK [Acidobacteriota bacterium]
MVNLFASLGSAQATLRSLQDGIGVSQNNVANASTPGYVKQRATLEALPFQPRLGLTGGVRSGPIQDSRSLPAERAVRSELSAFGNFAQQAESLSQLEGVLQISAEFGIPASLNQFFNSFAALSASPNSIVARQGVMEAAALLAEGFNRAGEDLARVRSQTEAGLTEVVGEINRIAAKIQSFNENALRNPFPDPGLEAGVFSDVEALSELVNIEVQVEANGSLTVLLGGQTPLVLGDKRQEIKLDYFVPPGPVNPGASPSARILDAAGRDITSTITQGRLEGLLHVHGEVLPSLAGDTQQDGSLNTLAKQLADRVNAILTGSLVSEGPPPVAGTPLFAYDSGNNANTARSLSVDPAATPALLAVISSGPPPVANGAALELADLGSSRDPQNTINGLTLREFYSSLARDVGERLNTADGQQARATLLVNQARELRQEISGVSLNEEAIHLTQFQRSYEAAAQIVKVIDELLQTALSLRR